MGITVHGHRKPHPRPAHGARRRRGTPWGPGGLATWHVEGDGCELLSIDTTTSGCGVGTALLATVADRATRAGCSRLWCVTTNDNTVALRFYRRRGWRITAWRKGAVDAARAVEPEIPLLGLDNIPIRDEIELELPLHERRPPEEAALPWRPRGGDGEESPWQGTRTGRTLASWQRSSHTYISAGLVGLWGVAHAIPTHAVVRGFGEISTDNRRVLIQEWLAEAVAMWSFATLVAVTTAVGDGVSVLEWVYRVVAGALTVLAVLTAFTGARTPVIWFKICPLVLTVSAVLLVIASFTRT